MAVQFLQCHLLKKFSSLHLIAFVLLWKLSWKYLRRSIVYVWFYAIVLCVYVSAKKQKNNRASHFSFSDTTPMWNGRALSRGWAGRVGSLGPPTQTWLTRMRVGHSSFLWYWSQWIHYCLKFLDLTVSLFIVLWLERAGIFLSFRLFLSLSIGVYEFLASLG